MSRVSDSKFFNTLALSPVSLRFFGRKTETTPSLPRAAADRLPFLDLLRAVAAQLIVWHHLAFYGPLADAAEPSIPYLRESLVEYGRMAVQIFLVVAGFVTARSLTKRTTITLRDAVQIVKNRYTRIAGPYLGMLFIAILANAVAREWMDHHSISDPPTVSQILAHAFFLQDIFGYEALSAGVWYLAIDFQLGLLSLALMMFSLKIGDRTGSSPCLWMLVVSMPIAAASLFWINGNSDWEHWALYFFGSYALGMVTAWVLSQNLRAEFFWIYAALMAIALIVEWRTRLAVSLMTGLAVFCAGRGGWLASWPKARWVGFAGATSYSLFLVHFPVCLVVSAWLSQFVLHSPALSIAGMLAAYALSLLAAIAFYFGVERQFR